MTTTHTIGLDLGGSFLKAGVVSESGTILERFRYAVDPSSAERVFRTVGEAVGACTDVDRSVVAVGLGMPGIMDHGAHVIMSSPNLHCLDGRALDGLMKDVCALPYVLDNDANCGAYGEFVAGAGRGTTGSFVLLTVGTGVGGGIILDGELWHGARGFAGEPGHVVIERDGRPCNCGGRGCLETRVSAGAVVAAYESRGGRAESAEEVARRAHGGEGAAIEALAEVGRDLGLGMAAIINLLNPEVIAVGGGVMGAGELLLGPARIEAEARAFRASFLSTRIVAATLQNDAGLVGAGLMARGAIQ